MGKKLFFFVENDREFPPYTCGACDHLKRDCTVPHEKYWCWGNPPHTNPVTGDTARAYTVENPNVPICALFKPRIHG